MEKIVEQGLLYDFYGELLTKHQQSVYEDVVFNDLSLSEIAEDLGVTRQGVHDTLVRAEAQLRLFEEKTGCIAREARTQQAADRIEAAAQALSELPGAAPLARQILAAVHEIKE